MTAYGDEKLRDHFCKSSSPDRTEEKRHKNATRTDERRPGIYQLRTKGSSPLREILLLKRRSLAQWLLVPTPRDLPPPMEMLLRLPYNSPGRKGCSTTVPHRNEGWIPNLLWFSQVDAG
ncbi:uncharacterized protein LOC142566388 isoform X2 [Dermacentor variabilis]|uniref:uncharacterized protein LOC142566388 isoform X2 n=1 Tax=Dermacentor variabilis TaxID=34621 RepID=UPI003F5C1E6E